MKYKAFISYKHSTHGRRYATALEKGLKQYARPILRPPIKIFRDEKKLNLGSNLPKSIKAGLIDSEYLIFIASEESANSQWCQDELNYWCKELKRIENLIIVWVQDDIQCDLTTYKIDWKKTNAIPQSISDELSYIPTFIDLRWGSNEDLDIQNTKFKSEINKITAKLRGVEPEHLSDEELKIYRKNKRIRNISIFILSILLLFSIATTNYAFRQTEEAKKNLLEAKYQKDIANKNFIEAECQKDEANKQKEIAQEQTIIANRKTDSINIEKRNAIIQKDIAENKQKELSISNRDLISKTYALKARQEFDYGDFTKAIRYAELSYHNHPTLDGLQILKEIASNPESVFYHRRINGLGFNYIPQTTYDPIHELIIYFNYDSAEIHFLSTKDSNSNSYNLNHGKIVDFTISPNCNKIGITHRNGVNTIWSYPEMKFIRQTKNYWKEVDQYNYDPKNIAISNDGEKIILSNKDSLIIIDPLVDSIVYSKGLNGYTISNIIGLRHEELFLLVLSSEIITLDYNGKYLGKIKTFDKSGTVNVTLSSTERYLACSDHKGEEILIFDRFDSTSKPIYTKKMPSNFGRINSISFSPNENTVVVAPDEAPPFIWEFSSPGTSTNLIHNNYWGNDSNCAIFSSDNEVLVTYQAYSLFFNLSKSLEHASSNFLDKEITCYSYSIEDTHLAIGYENNEVFILSKDFVPLDTLSFAKGIMSMDIDKLDKMQLLGQSINDKSGVTDLIFSSNENYVVTEFFYRYAFLWDIKNRAFIKGFEYNFQEETSYQFRKKFRNKIHFSSDNKYVVIPTGPKSIELYEFFDSTSKMIDSKEKITNLILSKDNYHLIVSTKNQIELYKNDGSHKSTHKVKNISTIFETSSNDVIICTHDGGIFSLDVKKNELKILRNNIASSSMKSIILTSKELIYFVDELFKIKSFDLNSKKEEFCFESNLKNLELKEFNENNIIAYNEDEIEIYNLEKKAKSRISDRFIYTEIYPLPNTNYLLASYYISSTATIYLIDLDGNILQELKDSYVIPKSRKFTDSNEKKMLFVKNGAKSEKNNTGILFEQSLLSNILCEKRTLTKENIPDFDLIKNEK